MLNSIRRVNDKWHRTAQITAGRFYDFYVVVLFRSTFVNVKEAADAVPGTVSVIEADFPQVHPRQGVQPVTFRAGREDDRG